MSEEQQSDWINNPWLVGFSVAAVVELIKVAIQ